MSNNNKQKDENFFTRLGWFVLILGLAGSIIWACNAPMDKGVSVSGIVITDSNRKTIQPAFSGIVDKIYVKEGQRVQAGQILVKLNSVNAQSQANAARESIGGLQAQAKGLEQSIEQKRKQITLFEKQLTGQRELAKEGYIAVNKLLELERQEIQVNSQIVEEEGNLLHIKKQISELKEKLNPFEYDLANTEIKSPVTGAVVNLSIFTPHGVVSPGQKLMEIVPSNESLVVEAQLPVNLIDKVHVNLPVELMFTAFNTNRTPHIPGVLASVDEDRIVDERTGNAYYKIQATITDAGKKLLRDLKVRPGMPVELFVKTGEQSMMTYLLKPVLDRSHSALSED